MAACYRAAVQARDTSFEAANLQIALLRELTPAARATMAAELSDAVRDTTLAGIRRRHPHLTGEEVARAFLALVYRHDSDR